MPGNRRSECRRATTSALVGALVAILLLPTAVLGVDPASPDTSPEPMAQTLPTEVPESASPSPLVDEPSSEPSDTPTDSPEPTASESSEATDPPTSPSPDPTESASASPSDPATPTPTTPEPSTSEPTEQSPTPTGSTSGPQTVRPLAEGDVTPLNGYRYTETTAAVHSHRDRSSSVVTTLAANTRVSVTEAVVQGGETWVETSAPAAGFVDGSLLSETSAPQPLSGMRRANVSTTLRSAMDPAAPVVVSIGTGAYVDAESTAYDSAGRRWLLAHDTIGSRTYRGYMLWSKTTTIRAALSGTWTVLRSTSMNRYALSGTAVKTIGAGTLAQRHWSVKDTGNVSWTYATVGSTSGWILSGYLTPPFKQYLWNRKNPVTQQYTNYWCVPASVQTELNIGLNGYSTSYWFQSKAYTYGRAHMGYTVSGRGLDPQSWQLSLSYFDYMFSSRQVDYVDATYSSCSGAIRAGVVQMRKTGLPVGLLVYYGGHAWTMIGYTATADPLKTSAWKLTGIYVAAPFRAWTDPPAGTFYTTTAFRQKMTPYYEASRWTRWNGLYTIVLPVAG